MKTISYEVVASKREIKNENNLLNKIGIKPVFRVQKLLFFLLWPSRCQQDASV